MEGCVGRKGGLIWRILVSFFQLLLIRWIRKRGCDAGRNTNKVDFLQEIYLPFIFCSCLHPLPTVYIAVRHFIGLWSYRKLIGGPCTQLVCQRHHLAFGFTYHKFYFTQSYVLVSDSLLYHHSSILSSDSSFLIGCPAQMFRKLYLERLCLFFGSSLLWHLLWGYQWHLIRDHYCVAFDSLQDQFTVCMVVITMLWL